MSDNNDQEFGVELRLFAKEFAGSAGELFTLDEIAADIGIHDINNVPLNQVEALTSINALFVDAKERFFENPGQEPGYETLTQENVRRLVDRFGSVMQGDPERVSSALYKALLSAAVNEGRSALPVSGENGQVIIQPFGSLVPVV